jgi:CoA:oxalate CoA-transferase
MDETKHAESGGQTLLNGLVVLDFTRVLAGPQCTRLLADLGARVIKIERPGEGDEMRRAPLRLQGAGDQSTYFARRNAGKESVAVDMSSPDSRRIICDLAAQADVAIENFVPGVAKKLGCDYEALRQVKPDLVHCSISGYGQTGPLSGRGAFAHVISAASGIMHLDSSDDGPRSSHLQAADVLAGTNAFGAIMAALWRRSRTGEGAQIDVSMLESLIASEDVSYATVPNGGEAMSGPRSGMGLSQVDGRWIAWQTGGAPMLWPRICAAMGNPELAHDARFATPDLRRENWPTLQATVGAWLGSFANRETALDALHRARIPAALVATPEEVVSDPHLSERGAFSDISHGGGGSVRVTSSPYWIDGAPVQATRSAPYQIGEHTRAVLTELLGYTDEALEHLSDTGVIALE